MSHSISEIVDTIQYKTKQSLEQIAENIGYSRPHLNKAKLSNEGENVKEALLKHYKEILQNVPEGNVIEEKTTEYLKRRRIKKNKHPVRFYDVDFLAGTSLIEFYDDSNMIEVAYEMDIPEFAGCTAFRAYSDSMEPLIKSGSILFGTKIDDWISHLEYGQIYGIVCNDGRRYLKYIRRHSDVKTTFLLRSENSEMYDEFELPKTAIKNLWLINGWLNRRT